MSPLRVALFGDALVGCVLALGVEIADDGVLAVIDADDEDALARASSIPASVPRVVVASPPRHASLRGLGIDQSRIVAARTPAVLGPAISALLPRATRAPTRVALVTGTRGGVGRTLLVTNLARRLARSHRVCVVDATGSGAVSWWFNTAVPAWSEFETLAGELTAEQLPIISREVARDIQVVGGGYVVPGDGIVNATVRCSIAAFDIVLVDAPLVFAPLCAAMRPLLDRVLVLTYDDTASLAGLECSWLVEGDWVIASQSNARRLADRDVFRTLDRDEAAIASAIGGRTAVAGRLGRAYDELADVLSIDASP